jgi:hypothetical protein
MEKSASARTLAGSRLGLVPLPRAPSWSPASDLALRPLKAFNRTVLIPTIEPDAVEWVQPLHRSTPLCKLWQPQYAVNAL